MNNNDLANRYNQWHDHNGVRFFLGNFYPDVEECRLLILKVIEQVVRDYLLLGETEVTNDQYTWEMAASFIFDDDYLLEWGDMELSPEELLDIVDVDIDWFRAHVKKRFRQKYGDNDGEKGFRYYRDSRG